jgi:hypothetical protein
MIKEAMNCREELSGLIIKQGTRVLKEEDLKIAMKGREFISIE